MKPQWLYIVNSNKPRDSFKWRCVSYSGGVLCFLQDEFRVESGERLLEMLEAAFSRKMNSPHGSWLISLSKPTRNDHQLLMTLASEQGTLHQPTLTHTHTLWTPGMETWKNACVGVVYRGNSSRQD